MSVNEVPAAPRPTAGLDWASTDHVIAVVGADGAEIDRFGITHSASGLRRLCRLLGRAGVGEVAIERGDGPVVEALLDAGFTVFVIHPTQLKNLRGRYGSAGRKDDRFDAYVLGDVLRTDRRRLRPLERDTEATLTLRATVRARRDLVGHRVALTNQLRAHLQVCFPAAVGLFADLDSTISLSFLRRFTDQTRADWLTPKRMAAWLRSSGYSGRTDPAVLHERLTHAPRGLTGPGSDARAAITGALLDAIAAINRQIATLAARIEEQLDLHPDAAIFTSLPRAGKVRAARLLAEIGDARSRYTTPEALTALAGVAPTTRQSGKVSVVAFRWAADKQLRDAICDFAGDSRHANPWAAQLYRRAIDRGHDHPHAVRILARAWLHVIWRCWQTNTPYDPTRHGALQALLQQHQQAAG
jgi:transposase